MALLKVTKNMVNSLDSNTLARILKQNPKLRNRVGSVLRPGDVVKISAADKARGNAKKDSGYGTKGQIPSKKSKPKPASQKVVIKPPTKPKSTKRSIVVKPLVKPVSVVRTQPQPQVARRAAAPQTRPAPGYAAALPQQLSPLGGGGYSLGKPQVYPQQAARFNTPAMANNSFNQQQANRAEAVRAMGNFNTGLAKELNQPAQQQYSPLGGGGYAMGRPLPKSPEQRRAEQLSGVPTPLTALGAERLGYTTPPTPRTPPGDYERAAANIGFAPGTIVAYRLSQGIRPLIISPEALAYMDSIGMTFADQDLLDMGYFFDGNNWIRLDKVDEGGNVTSSSGQQLYQSYGYGGGYGGYGGGGYGGGGYGYAPDQQQKRLGSEFGLVTWRI